MTGRVAELSGQVRAGRIAWAISGWLFAFPLHAFEVNVTAPEAIADDLRGASATVAAKTAKVEGAQEVYAAALSDYRTLVQVLYDAGYFSPSVSIRLDGREAAEISTLNPPTRVAKVVIAVDPGPRQRAQINRSPGTCDPDRRSIARAQRPCAVSRAREPCAARRPARVGRSVRPTGTFRG